MMTGGIPIEIISGHLQIYEVTIWGKKHFV